MAVRVLRSALPPVLVVVVATWLLLGHFGVSTGHVLRMSGYLLVCVALPGVFTWRLLLRRLPGPRTWFEDLTLGTIFGFGVQLPFFLLGVATGRSWLTFAPVVLALVLSVATPFGRRCWALPTSALDVRAAWAFSAVILFGEGWLARNVWGDRPLSLPPNLTPSIDETFHQALVAEVGSRFPPEIPFLLGTRLDYHWFVHAQMAAIHQVTGIEVVELIRLVMPATTLVLAVLGLGAVALRLTGRPATAVVAPTLLVLGAYQLVSPDFDPSTYLAPYLSRRFVSSPSQSYGVMMSMPALLMVLEVLRPRHPPERRPPWPVWVALTLTLLALAGSKATFLPIFVCGAAAVVLVELVVQHRVRPATAGCTVVLLAVTAFAQVVLFGGESGSMVAAPWESVDAALANEGLPSSTVNTILMTVFMLLGWLLYGVGLVGLRHRILEARVVWLVVSVAAGVTVPFVFFRSGLSQYWFSRSVAELVVLLSAWGLACLLPRPLTARTAGLLVGVAATTGLAAYGVAAAVDAVQGTSRVTPGAMVVTATVPVALVLAWLGTRRLVRRPAGRAPGLLVLVVALLSLTSVVVFTTVADTLGNRPIDYRSRDEISQPLFPAGGAAAAAYVARNSPADAVVATNIHCLDPSARRCDNRGFWVAAYSKRRVVVQGWGYTAPTNAQYELGDQVATLPMPDPERLRVNDAVFTRPSAETLRRLVDAYGVDWLLVGRTRVARETGTDLAGLRSLAERGELVRRYSSRNYVVYEVSDRR